MFGLIGKMVAVEGKRDDLIRILVDGTSKMPGCISYVVAKDSKDANGIWVTEVWDSKEDHDNSLQVPGVKELIAQAMPLLAGRSEKGLELEVLGGAGLE